MLRHAFPGIFQKRVEGEERKDVVNLELFLLNTDLFVNTMHIEREEERGEDEGGRRKEKNHIIIIMKTLNRETRRKHRDLRVS